jgi:hypothetical protein
LFFIAVIKHQCVPVFNKYLVDMLKGRVVSARLCWLFPGRFLAPPVIVSCPAHIVAKLAVFPAGA